MIQAQCRATKEKQPITGINLDVLVYKVTCTACGAVHDIKALAKSCRRSHDRLDYCGRGGCIQYLTDIERFLNSLRKRLNYHSITCSIEPLVP